MNPYLDLLAHIQGNAFNSSPLGLEGTLDGTTYDPKSGTVRMVVGEGYADSLNAYQTPYEVIGTLMTEKVGKQDAPWGGERAIAVPTRGGWRLWLCHGEDDSGLSDAPGAPLGESWHLHAQQGTVGAGMTPVWDSGIKLTNDGPTAGDGMGGTIVGNTGALTAQVTSNPTQFQQLNATAQTIVTQATTGLSSILDVQGTITGVENSISHVVPSLGLITLGAGVANTIPSTMSAINQDIMNGPYATLVNNFMLGNLQTYITALTAALSEGGLPNPTAFSDKMIALIIGSWLTKIESVTGSSLVRIATGS